MQNNIEGVFRNKPKTDGEFEEPLTIHNSFVYMFSNLMSINAALKNKAVSNSIRYEVFKSVDSSGLKNDVDVDMFISGFIDKQKQGLERFTIFLPGQLPINVRMHTSNSHHVVYLDTKSIEMRCLLRRNKEKMEQTVKEQAGKRTYMKVSGG